MDYIYTSTVPAFYKPSHTSLILEGFNLIFLSWAYGTMIISSLFVFLHSLSLLHSSLSLSLSFKDPLKYYTVFFTPYCLSPPPCWQMLTPILKWSMCGLTAPQRLWWWPKMAHDLTSTTWWDRLWARKTSVPVQVGGNISIPGLLMAGAGGEIHRLWLFCSKAREAPVGCGALGRSWAGSWPLSRGI